MYVPPPNSASSSHAALGPMAHIVVDVDGRIVDADSIAGALFDRAEEELRGTSLNQLLVHHDNRIRTILARVRRHLASRRSGSAWSTLEVRGERGRGRRCIVHMEARGDGLLDMGLAPLP